MTAYPEPSWTTPETLADEPLKGAAIFAASKSDMIALVIELLKSYFSMEEGLRHPKLEGLELRGDDSSAAGLRIKAGVADETNIKKPCIFVYSAGQAPVHTFVDTISVSTPSFTIPAGGRNGTEYIVLHVYAERAGELQALADECQRFWSMMREKTALICSGFIDISPVKGSPMGVDDRGRLNVQVPAQYSAHWRVQDLPEDGY